VKNLADSILLLRLLNLQPTAEDGRQGPQIAMAIDLAEALFGEQPRRGDPALDRLLIGTHKAC
jgi:hypothetical protein